MGHPSTLTPERELDVHPRGARRLEGERIERPRKAQRPDLPLRAGERGQVMMPTGEVVKSKVRQEQER